MSDRDDCLNDDHRTNTAAAERAVDTTTGADRVTVAAETEQGKATITVLRPWYLLRPMDIPTGKKEHSGMFYQ